MRRKTFKNIQTKYSWNKGPSCTIIGRGPYSNVYLGHEITTKRKVAIKVIRKAAVMSAGIVHHVIREKDILE
jgi:serine/threonine protein kinase